MYALNSIFPINATFPELANGNFYKTIPSPRGGMRIKREDRSSRKGSANIEKGNIAGSKTLRGVIS